MKHANWRIWLNLYVMHAAQEEIAIKVMNKNEVLQLRSQVNYSLKDMLGLLAMAQLIFFVSWVIANDEKMRY